MKLLISRSMRKMVNTCVLVLLLAWVPVAAQSVRYTVSPINAESVLKEESVRQTVDFLTRESTGGRAMGTEGSRKVVSYLEDRFHALGLYPVSGAWQHGFTSGGIFGRNVMGIIPGSSSKYVILMAHFDNLGMLGGTFYPGADSNASGVAALLEVAGMMAHMHLLRRSYSASLLVVALDGKEKDLSGASALWRGIADGKLLDPVSGKAISASDISLVVNLDQLGATLAPLTEKQPNYVMMLSREATGRRSSLQSVNKERKIDLELAFDYYGSKDFTRLFYERVSDQRIFLEHGIPAVMFTSGITLNNNKPYDNAASLDYPVLLKRIRLIFYYLDKVL